MLGQLLTRKLPRVFIQACCYRSASTWSLPEEKSCDQIWSFDAAQRSPPIHDENGGELQTQNISIPSDMVGCIIGRAGSKISEIRKTSGTRISIGNLPSLLTPTIASAYE